MIDLLEAPLGAAVPVSVPDWASITRDVAVRGSAHRSEQHRWHQRREPTPL